MRHEKTEREGESIPRTGRPGHTAAVGDGEILGRPIMAAHGTHALRGLGIGTARDAEFDGPGRGTGACRLGRHRGTRAPELRRARFAIHCHRPSVGQGGKGASAAS